MKLTNGELYELAEFFAKRFPEARHRTRVAKEAKLFHLEGDDLTPAEAWQTLLSKGHEHQCLHRMARAASTMGEQDENLDSVCELLWATRPSFVAQARQHSAALGLILAVGVGALGALSLSGSPDAGEAIAAMNTTSHVPSRAYETHSDLFLGHELPP